MSGLRVSIYIDVSGQPSPASFADQVGHALPDDEFLTNLRLASIPAILPITYKLGRTGTIVIEDA